MIKAPYDMVMLQADHLLELAIVAQDFQDRRTYLDQYYEFLNATGWTDYEYDAETLRRVDNDWDNAIRIVNVDNQVWN